MSAWSASDPRRARPARPVASSLANGATASHRGALALLAAAALVLALGAAALALAPATARAATHHDAGRKQHHIIIGAGTTHSGAHGAGSGVGVLDGDTSDSTTARTHRPVVEIGRHDIDIETDDPSVVRMFTDVTIDSAEVVEGSVVAVFGNVNVIGHVHGDVVAVLGGVHLADGSSVDGDAVAVGGGLTEAPHAQVTGQSVSLTFLPFMPGIPAVRALFIALAACWLFGMLAGMVLAVLMPRAIGGVARTMAESSARSLLFGFLMPPLATVVGILLLVTLIGIPVAFLLPLVYLVMLWVGLIAGSYLLGCRLLRRGMGEGGMAAPVFATTLLLAPMFGIGALWAGHAGVLGNLALFFPILGMLLVTALSVIGSGALLTSAFQRRQPPAPVEAYAPPPAPPTPAPAAPPIAG